MCVNSPGFDVASCPNCGTDKEVEGFYDDGMRVEDDITLLWTDDKYVIFGSQVPQTTDSSIFLSFGNIRRFPLVSERNRTGGAGKAEFCYVRCRD